MTGVSEARVGDLLADDRLRPDRARRIEATAVILPGATDLSGYLASLEAAHERFSAWDGRTVVLDDDVRDEARAVIVDRYGQVYAVLDAVDGGQLPDADALEEWFKFLATACPECGVLDDPVRQGPTP